MRKISLLILFVLIISLVTPLYAMTPAMPTDDTPAFLTLDVCGASGPLHSAKHDTPSIYECPGEIASLEFAGFHSAAKPVFSFLLIPSQEERPPKICS
jgi:hypothetical protein